MSKDEVIKKAKKVRTIVIESQANVIVMLHYFNSLVTIDRNIARGRGIGLSSVGGSFKILVMRWFGVWSRYEVGGWNEFLSFMKRQPMSESDKQQWESSSLVDDSHCSMH